MSTEYRIHATVLNPLVEKTIACLQRILSERTGIRIVNTPIEQAELVLDIQPGIGAEGFRIEDDLHGSITITGDCERGLLYGVGKLLHDARYGDGQFTPGLWRGVSVPDCPLRGIYFALHNNVYCHASLDELEQYIEELALWGINTIAFHLPLPVDSTTPEARVLHARNHELLLRARNTGMRIALLNSINCGLPDAPVEALAAEFPDTVPARRGYADVRVCPSHPLGFNYLSKFLARYLDGFQDIGVDYAVAFPYDSGGCGCPECWPWGARGYLTIAKEFSRLARQLYPAAQLILGTWCYDVLDEPDGEWEGLAAALTEDRSWVEYIMADSHFEFPEYPLTHGVPGGLPMINFAEISMWGRFPWGGYGANPLPARFQRIWDESKEALSGGLPYSEGNFEDINKVIFARFFWDKQAGAFDTVRDYIAYEYSPEVVEQVLEAITCLERTYPRSDWQIEDVDRAYALLQAADAQLPARARACWRWRILYLRALIDVELLHHENVVTDRCDAAYEELIRIFHLQDGWHCVTPPSREYRRRNNANNEEVVGVF